jgi:hypothetical protein
VIRTLHAQLRALEREGRACLFPGADEPGRTVVTVIVDPRFVPDHDALLTEADRRRRW